GELLWGRAVVGGAVLGDLLERDRQRLVRHRRHLGRDDRADALAQAVVVRVDLARAHRAEGYERELRVDRVQQLLDRWVHQGGSLDRHGASSVGAARASRSPSSIERSSAPEDSRSSFTTTWWATSRPAAISSRPRTTRAWTCDSVSPRCRSRSLWCASLGGT